MRADCAGRNALAGALTILLLAALIVGNPSPAVAGAPVTPPDLKIVVPTDLISIGVDPSSGARDLRFTHITADVGTGPFEIDPTYDSNTGTSTFAQVIYNSPSPGVWERDHSVPIAMSGVWRPPSDYQFPLTRFTLNRLNADGSLGAVIATSPKADYCITGDYRLAGVANTPDQTFIPQENCSNPTKPLGWSVGWGDEYDQTDAGQPIDLTGIADGTYILHAIVDPMHVLTESNTANDVTDTGIRISGTTVTVLSQTNPGKTPPTVSLTHPAAGDRVSGRVTLSASASSTAPATVTSVQFMLDGQPLGAPVTGPSYTYTWIVGSTPLGDHLLSARARDSNGTPATAAPVRVTVGSGPSRGGPGPPGGGPGQLKLRVLRWSQGVLTLVARDVPAHARVLVKLEFAHAQSRLVYARHGRLRLHTLRPKVIVLRALVGKRQLGKTLTVRLGRAPTVHITNPIGGETLSGTVPVVADARDDVAVVSVRFSIDGRPIGRPVTRPPYVIHWKTRRVRPGRHRVSALATDPNGNSAKATVVVRVQNPPPPMTCFVLQAHISAHGHGVATAANLVTAAPDETLLAFVSADGPAGARRQSAAVSGAGLTWKLVKRANASSGDSEIWAARAHSILNRSNVNAQLADRAFDESLTVVAMEGAKGLGSAAGASATTGSAHLVLTTQAATSLVFAVGNDWDRARTRTFPPGWVALDQWLDSATGDTFWSQYTNQTIGRARTRVAVKVAAPSTDQWNLAAVELVGSGN